MGSGISTKYQINLKEDNGLNDKQSIDVAEKSDDDRINVYFVKKLNQSPEENASYSQNLMSTSDYYLMDEKGRFGEPGSGHNVRIIECDNVYQTAMDFYDHLTDGCKIHQYRNEMKLYTVIDNYRLNFRPYTSTPGSPAVDIFIESANKLLQKIHFIERKL